MTTLLRRLVAGARRLLSSRAAERALDDDVREYAHLLADEHMAAGMTPADAKRQALIDLGGMESVKESVRSVRTGAHLEQFLRDLRYAAHGLRRAPGFTLTVVLTLGLGIGANTTVFSIVNATLFKPVPYDRPEELVDVGHRTGAGATEMLSFSMSWEELAFWRAQTSIFQGAEVRRNRVEQLWREGKQTLNVAAMTPGLPALFGVSPQVGRVFTREEALQREPVVVISDTFWARGFNRSPEVVGTTLTLNDRVVTIIGVMPPTFRFGAAPSGEGAVHAWTVLAERGGMGGTSPVLRLRTGLTLEEASRLATEAAIRFQATSPEGEGDEQGSATWSPVLVRVAPTPGLGKAADKPMLFLLFGIAMMVLLIACANIANMLSTRTLGRGRELAVRAALGASRARLLRLLLTEGVLVALLGGAVAVLFAKWTAALVFALTPSRLAWQLFRVSPPDLDWRVLGFTALTTTMVVLLATVWPALRGSHVGRLPNLSEGAKVTAGSPGRRRVNLILQVVQVTLALLLVTTSAVFATSLSRLLAADLGFDPRNLVKADITLPPARFATPESRLIAMDEILERVRATPGIQHAAIGSSPPINNVGRMVLPGGPVLAANRINADVRYASPGYFDTAGIAVLAGREFDEQDTMGAPLVAIIDEAGARRMFPNESPLGKTFSAGPGTPQRTIVGVVRTVSTMTFPAQRETTGLYFAQRQTTSGSGFTLLVRADAPVIEVISFVQSSLSNFDPGLKATNAALVSDFYEHTMETYATPRYHVTLIASLAGIALLTAAVGLYGALAFAVRQREREIGVRLALGAGTGQIRRLVLNAVLKPVAAGVAISAAGIWFAGGLIQSFLYNVSARDPRLFAASAVVLLIVAIGAALIPLRRATGVSPVGALRVE